MKKPQLFTAVVLATFVVCSTRAVAIPPIELPGYVVEEYGQWQWASRGGRVPPSERLVDYFENTLARIRGVLAAREPRGILVVYTSQRGEFLKVVQHCGAAPPPDFTLALAFPERGIMVLDGERLRSQPMGTYPETIAHEIAHLVLGAGGAHVPRWYHEGLAQWLSGATLDWETRNLLALLARKEALVPFVEMSGSFPETHRLSSIYYRQSLSFVDYLSRRFGIELHAKIVAACERKASLEAAFHELTGVSLSAVEGDWLTSLAAEFSWLRVFAQSIGLFHIIAGGVILGFILQRIRRRRALRRMALEEERIYGEDA